MSDHNDSSDTMSDPTSATGETGRSVMHDQTTTPRRGHARRLVVGAAVVGAMALLASAAAWACTLRDGTTLEVFQTPLYSSCAGAGPTGQYCSKAVGNGAQTGLATVDNVAGQNLRIMGSGFIDTTELAYSITWRKTTPATGNCHRVNTDGSIVLMGGSATVTSGGTLDVTRDAISETPNSGLARICVQDYQFGGTSTASATPTVVIGQIVDVSVVDI